MKSQANPPIFWLDRPERANALDVGTAEQLQRAIQAAEKERASGLIIASKLPRVFCAGGDLQAYSQMKTKAQGVKANRQIRKILDSMKSSKILIVAAIEGETIGGGCELALASDFIFAGAAARFAFKQVAQKLTPGWGGYKRLMNRVNSSTALSLLATGQFVSAFEAKAMGLVDDITAPSEAITKAINFLNSLSDLPESYIKHLKKLSVSHGQGEEKVFEKLWFSSHHREVLRKK